MEIPRLVDIIAAGETGLGVALASLSSMHRIGPGNHESIYQTCVRLNGE